jgi:hypothetical protein
MEYKKRRFGSVSALNPEIFASKGERMTSLILHKLLEARHRCIVTGK